MLNILFLLCLVSTIFAAPAQNVDRIQKRAVTCNVAYGTKINAQACLSALKDVPDTIIGQDMHFVYNAVSGKVSVDAEFSNNASNKRYRLPQYFGNDGACTLGVSLTKTDAAVKFTWGALKRELSKIIDECIEKQGGTGGISTTYAGVFDLAIWAEPLTQDEPPSDTKPAARGYCKGRPSTRLFDCLRACFSGDCRAVPGPIATS